MHVLTQRLGFSAVRPGTLRTASAVATSAFPFTELIALDRTVYQRYVSTQHKLAGQATTVLEFLRRLHPFRRWKRPALVRLCVTMSRRVAPANVRGWRCALARAHTPVLTIGRTVVVADGAV